MSKKCLKSTLNRYKISNLDLSRYSLLSKLFSLLSLSSLNSLSKNEFSTILVLRTSWSWSEPTACRSRFYINIYTGKLIIILPWHKVTKSKWNLLSEYFLWFGLWFEVENVSLNCTCIPVCLDCGAELERRAERRFVSLQACGDTPTSWYIATCLS